MISCGRVVKGAARLAYEKAKDNLTESGEANPPSLDAPPENSGAVGSFDETRRRIENKAKVAALSERIEREPMNAEHYSIRALYNSALGYLDLALRDHDKAVQLAPTWQHYQIRAAFKKR